MAAIAGKSCSLYQGAVPTVVTLVQSIKCGQKVDVMDTTSMGDTWETFLAGIKGGETLTAEMLYDPTDASQVALRDGLGTAITLEVRYGTTVPKISASCLITGFSIDADKAGVVKASLTAQPTGTITCTDA